MIAEELIKKANDCNKDAHTALNDLDDMSIRKFVNDNKNILPKYELFTLDALNKHELMLADDHGDWPTYHVATCEEETKRYYSLAHEIISKVTQREESDKCVLTIYGRKNETENIFGYAIMKILTYGKALECIKDSQTDYNGNARITFEDGFNKYYKNYGEEYNQPWD